MSWRCEGCEEDNLDDDPRCTGCLRWRDNPPASERNPVKELCRLIEKAGVRVTFDPDRDASKPCIFCGEADQPRKLVDIGVWTVGRGCWMPGDAITRPLCSSCAELAEATRRPAS